MEILRKLKKLTIGTPAQYRKWFTKREGEITI